ncbi:MAG: T9SS type A sorting domain-containing protein [Taibaiella sp.]|nr:T9SS type A sorting domain-containing protein [Taibaiella sp.]
MKRLLLPALFFTLFMLSTFYSGRAQSWQWGKRGGGSVSTGIYGSTENVIDIATDKWGNLYVLANVFGYSPDIDGHAKTGYGYQNISIASFKCDGTYRWSKVIGSLSADNAAQSIKADTLGGVYIAGYMQVIHGVGPAYIDSDTLITETNKSLFILKYDTSGAYKWIRMPQSDTVSTGAIVTTVPIDMDADKAGNTALLCMLPPGAYVGGIYIVTSPGLYLMKYDRNGKFITGHSMQITYSVPNVLQNIHMTWDAKRDLYYIGGTHFPSGSSVYKFGATKVSYCLYLGAFDNAGINKWTKQNNDSAGYGGVANRPLVDPQGYIYITGATAPGYTFNGATFHNSFGLSSVASPFLIKLDSNGDNIWATNASTDAASEGSSVALFGDTVAVIGDYPGRFSWDSYTRNTSGYHIFIATINAHSGLVIGVDTLAGGDAYPTSLGVDNYGNYYAGGQFQSNIIVASENLHSSGGETDFFIAKFGRPNCEVDSSTSIKSFPSLNEVVIFPIPMEDNITIEGLHGITLYKIFDLTGRQVCTGLISNNKETIYLDRLHAGTYLLQLASADGGRLYKTLVKK